MMMKYINIYVCIYIYIQISSKLREAFEAAGKEVLVQVTAAMGEEHITAFRETNN